MSQLFDGPQGRNGPLGVARQQSLRDHNLAVVLRRVVDSEAAVSRADIAAATGLTRSTVSNLVETLLGADLLTEVAPAPRPGAGAGRPGIGLVPCTTRVAGLGLELNVDYLAACVLDLTGAQRHRSFLPRDLRGLDPDRAVAALAPLAHAALADAASQGLVVCGAAVALPGLVHAPDGPLHLAPNLGWRDVDVLALLRRDPELAALERRGAVGVDNEANLAALGELYAGRRAGAAGELDRESFLYVSGEIGVGAALVLEGRVFRGVHGWGGEIGHLPVYPDGPACSCGSRGCLEQVAGQEAIVRRAGMSAPAGTSPAGRPVAEQLAAAAAAGDGQVLAALTEAGHALGVAVSAAVNLVDVGTVVLGGLYATLARWLAPIVQDEVATRVPAHAWSPVTVRVSALGGDAATLGAAGAVVRSVVDAPAEALRALDPLGAPGRTG